MNQKVKNITKSMIFVGLITSASNNAEGYYSVTNTIGSGLKKVATATKDATFWSVNHAIAVAPDWYEAMVNIYKIENPDIKTVASAYIDAATNLRDPRALISANALLLFLNPIIVHVGLQTIKYTLINKIIEVLVKDVEKQDRVKKAFATVVQFCGTRIALSLFLRPILLNGCASELANILYQYNNSN